MSVQIFCGEELEFIRNTDNKKSIYSSIGVCN